MDKEQTLALWAKGREEWNAWAKEMLDRRAAMEKAGEWASSRGNGGREEGDNDATRAWVRASIACFDNHLFDKSVDFSRFLFPIVSFANTSFSSADFRHARFRGDAYFGGVTFYGGVMFSHAEFRFINFRRSTYSSDVAFSKVKFFGSALFLDATFESNAWFSEANFSEIVSFSRANFKATTSFDGVRFEEATDFEAIIVNSSFSLEGAYFRAVPNFIQAHFEEAPRLDNVRVASRGGFQDAAACYRALKRLAIDGHDHEREQEFFARELKALRGHHDKLLPNPRNLFRRDEDRRRRRVWPGGGRYWFGLGYQILSDFGRSMLRPLGWLLLGIGVFGWAYLGAHFARSTYGVSSGAWLLGRLGERVADLLRWLASGFPPEAALRDIAGWLGRLLAPSAPLRPLTCIAGDQTDPLSAAIGLSVRKALPFAGVASSEKLNQIYACLYGITDLTDPGKALPGRFTPLIPDGVDGLGIFQILFSLVLLFLFALALRNHFRIR